jgi:hypothetical protein
VWCSRTPFRYVFSRAASCAQAQHVGTAGYRKPLLRKPTGGNSLNKPWARAFNRGGRISRPSLMASQIVSRRACRTLHDVERVAGKGDLTAQRAPSNHGIAVGEGRERANDLGLGLERRTASRPGRRCSALRTRDRSDPAARDSPAPRPERRRSLPPTLFRQASGPPQCLSA